MSCAYVVLRGALFHFRIRVPADLVSAFGRREVRMSLGEARQRHAALKAAQLGLHAQSLFNTVRRFMKHLTSEQIAQLVAAWRDRMSQRDTEIRRQIEVGLHSHSLDSYASHCSAHADVFEQLLEDLTVPPAVHDAAEYRVPSERERDAAYRSAAETMTISDDPESDLVPLTDSASLAELDTLSRLDLAKHYLAAGARIYSDRENACRSLTLTASPSTPAALQHAPTIENAVVAPTTGELLSEAWEAYKQDRARRARGWKDGVPDKAVLAFKDFIELIGDKPLREVSRADCTRFRDFQEMRPKGNVRQYRGISATSIETMEIGQEHRQSAQNAEHKIGEIVSFFRWCEREDRITKSPAERLEVASEKGDPVEPWSQEEIRKLLSPTMLRTHSGMLDPRSNLAYFPWLVVLGAYTGARLGEIVNVRIEDFLVKDPESQGDVPVMVVDAYEGKSIKTKNAKRKIPLHPDLETLGLWDYVETRQRAGETMLLDCKEKSGSRAKEATQRFTKYTQRMGLHQPRVKVFHSFRHAFKTQLEGHIAKSDVDLVLGHSRKDSTGGVYSHPLKIPMHRHHEAIKQLSFGLDVPALRDMLLNAS